MNRPSARDMGLLVAATLSLCLALAVTVGGVRTVRVLSASMTPSFAPGDVLVTREQRVADLRPGQIVVLPMSDGTPYAHRVISATTTNNGTEIRTRGDANGADDPWIVEVRGDTVQRAVTRVPTSWIPAQLLAPDTARRLLGVGVVVLALSSARRRFSARQQRTG